jgi:hypothetical protein
LIRPLAVLVSGVLGAWLLTVGCALLLRRGDLVLPTLVAALICLIPAVLTLVWALRARPPSAAARLQLLVFGSLIRMSLTAAGGMAAYLLIERCETVAFLVALLGFYMLALALETRLLASQSGKVDNLGH